MKKPKDLIQDPHFKVQINPYGSSLHPDISCWQYMHDCVSTTLPLSDKHPINPTAAIIKHALESRKHWHVLDASYLVLHISGFDHNTAMQFRTHKGNDTLCQSMRYTTLDNNKSIDELFYIPPYASDSYKYIARSRCQEALNEYYDCDEKPETKRYLLPTNFRQKFVMGGNAREWLHMFYARLLRDTQIEAQTAAWAMMDACLIWWPELFEWYLETSAGKNMMSP